MSTIGDRIRQRREQIGMSQAELAVLSGYKSRASINKIEMGERDIRQNKIKVIADALRTSPSYLMGWVEPEAANENKKDAPAVSESVKNLVELISQLTPENQETLATVARGLLLGQSDG